MSRRQHVTLILILVAVVIAGFLFGRIVLPRIVLRILEHEFELQDTSGTGWNLTCAAPNVSGWFPIASPARLGTLVSSRLVTPARRPGSFDLALGVNADVLQRPVAGDNVRMPGATSEVGPGTELVEPVDLEDAQPVSLASGDFEDVWIEVDVTEQLVRIMDGDKVIKETIASTGKEGHETPLGTFEIQNRGTWFYSEKYQQGAKYWVSFKDWGLYLFHSVVMDKDGQVIQEEAEKLGRPASHGCVRLSIEDAKWIYDNIPEKTKVVIRE
jgi:lipoprotein-anchoring transpeptidase ErfK/SrfK